MQNYREKSREIHKEYINTKRRRKKYLQKRREEECIVCCAVTYWKLQARSK
jgi:hypothetical protein